MSDRRTWLRVLSDEQIKSIHLASLQILERTGVEVRDPTALDLLREAGARVNGTRARIPASLVKWALEVAPERVTLYTRDGKPDVLLEDRRVYFGTGSDLPFTIDLHTGERRPTTKQDVGNVARVCDALPNIAFVMSGGIATDVRPTRDSFVHQFEAMVANTTKPIVFTAQDNEDVRCIHEMATIVAGGADRLARSPFLALYSEPITPLIHTRMGTEKVLFCAEHGIPVVYTPGLMAGGTAPVTMAGAIAQGNAELLSGLAIAQLGARRYSASGSGAASFIYGGVFTAMDMRTCIFSYGSPSLMLMSAALADLAHFYRLPVFGVAATTDAKTADVQAGIEYGASVLMAALSGSNLVHDVGYVDSGLTMSLEMLVAADEIVAMVRGILDVVEVNDETLALDVIDRVGPGGHFLSDPHTLAHCRSAHWHPVLMDRANYDQWTAAGKTTYQQRLNERAREILSTHQPAPLSEEKARAVSQAMAARNAKPRP